MKAWSSLHIPESVRVATIKAAAEAYDVMPGEIEGGARSTRIVHARQYTVWLLRERRRPCGEPRHGWVEIGRALGLDHTTAIHSWHRVEARLGEREQERAA